MSFNELVRLLKANGFSLLKEKGSIRYYGKPSWPRLIRVDFHGGKEVPTGTCTPYSKRPAFQSHEVPHVIDLPYSLVIEATSEPDFFGFYSLELEGFSGIGHSVEDCLYKARHGMKEHVDALADQKLAIPPGNPNPTITIKNEAKGSAA